MTRMNHVARSRKKNLSELVCILEKYQENGALLDPHLEKVTETLFGGVRTVPLPDQPHQLVRSPRLHRLCAAIYTLCKVRGRKAVAKYFPHEVVDVITAVRLLLGQDRKHHETWRTRYALLLWLSVLSLSTLDAGIASSIFRPAVLLTQELPPASFRPARITFRIRVPRRTAAAVCVSRLLSRSDLEGS